MEIKGNYGNHFQNKIEQENKPKTTAKIFSYINKALGLFKDPLTTLQNIALSQSQKGSLENKRISPNIPKAKENLRKALANNEKLLSDIKNKSVSIEEVGKKSSELLEAKRLFNQAMKDPKAADNFEKEFNEEQSFSLEETTNLEQTALSKQPLETQKKTTEQKIDAIFSKTFIQKNQPAESRRGVGGALLEDESPKERPFGGLQGMKRLETYQTQRQVASFLEKTAKQTAAQKKDRQSSPIASFNIPVFNKSDAFRNTLKNMLSKDIDRLHEMKEMQNEKLDEIKKIGEESAEQTFGLEEFLEDNEVLSKEEEEANNSFKEAAAILQRIDTAISNLESRMQLLSGDANVSLLILTKDLYDKFLKADASGSSFLEKELAKTLGKTEDKNEKMLLKSGVEQLINTAKSLEAGPLQGKTKEQETFWQASLSDAESPERNSMCFAKTCILSGQESALVEKFINALNTSAR